jgi:pimeloyl-ACP methyl ester carboxylesterase
MIPRMLSSFFRTSVLLCAMPAALYVQNSPYDIFPAADAPYYRVRYEASTQPGELIFPVNYTVWIPRDVKTLRGVVVHQHGCGEGSCKSGLTGAYDLHWQALAKKHECALLAPSYEQPQGANCQMWCDPRNGSDAAFQKCLVDLGQKSGHPELAAVPWALWGHSGGGHWAGGMVLLHPERVAAAWLRSGVPLLTSNPERPEIKAHTLPDAALRVPMMCNPGTKEGVTVKDGRFAKVWPANEAFFYGVRGKGGLIGVSVDPLSAHECGNQRYFAIPWLDACLSARLPNVSGKGLNAILTDAAWLASPTGFEAVPATKFKGDPLKAAWLLNEAIARGWMQYVKNTDVTDTTPPPAPSNLRLRGNKLSWQAEADLESGLARFIIERDGEFLANVPEQSKNRFGRPIFQNLQYSDTPTQPLVPMNFTDTNADPGKKHTYRVIAVNTVGLKSKPGSDSVAGGNRKRNACETNSRFVPSPLEGRRDGNREFVSNTFLSDDLFRHLASDIRQPKLAALVFECQLFVVDAEQTQ